MALARHLASVPLFEGLPEENLRDLEGILEDRTCVRGQIIFSEGDEGAGFYVVISGRVKIFKLSPDGKEQILHIFGPGEPFGEVPVFAGRNFPAHAEAMEKSRIFFFPRKAFIHLVGKNPSLALNMLAVLSYRLRRFTALVEDLSLKEVPGRLAAHLLFLSAQEKGSADLVLSITKAQLASLLGTIPETLSRILAKMTSQGLIETRGPSIRILDPGALEELAAAERRL
ncbi:MAG: Crp/Fnr family transcriptional regulator [Deltaproteobacteria bacterium]|nr:Crp/Fnr family transcriptional regulator [Deltaproteobacteria bacterium]